MTNEEIREKFKNMWGDEEHKLKILKELTGLGKRDLNKILKGENLAPATTVYHADDNPYCKVDDKAKAERPNKKELPAAVFEAISDKLDSIELTIKYIEAEIREKEAKKKELELSYQELAAYIGGKQ